MQLVNESINISVISYKQEQSNISYIIEIKTRYKQLWQLSKRYSQFEEMHKKLTEIFHDLPSLPKKSFLTFLVGKSKEELEDRRIGLEEYLRQLIVRREIYNSTVLRDFLKLDQCDDINQPVFIAQHALILGVRDFIFSHHQGLLFALTADMNVMNRVDAYVNNIKMPWEDDKDNSKTIPVGTVECFTQNENEDGFVRVWKKEYSSQAICMYWDKVLCILLIGLDSGKINYLKLSEKANFKKYDESIEIEMHVARVMGVYFWKDQIHSISKDTHYKIVDLEKGGLVADIEIGQYELTSLLVSEERNISIIGDRNGEIMIINLKEKPKVVLRIQTNTTFIRGLYLDNEKNYLMSISYDDGFICVLDVAKGLNDKQATIKTKIQGKPKSREIQWSRKRGELMIGNDDGTVTIYNALDLQPIFVLKAHDKAITRMIWYEEQSILVTGSKDEKIKWWHFPKKWKIQEVSDEIKQKAIMDAKMQNLLKIQSQNSRVDSDDDDVDLGRWHK